MDQNEMIVQIHNLNSSSSIEKESKNSPEIAPLIKQELTLQLNNPSEWRQTSKKNVFFLSPRQARALKILMIACNFFLANGNSLQGPFYPREAEKKNVRPLIYSAIFASYDFTMLLTSFAFNHITDRFQANLVIGLSLFTTGLSTILFGTLTYINGKDLFIIGSFLTRIIESLGATLFAICSYSFISVCFPTSTGTTFGMMEMAFGLGMITGPMIGGALYTFGGFFFPFSLIGTLISALGLAILLPKVDKLFRKAKNAGEKETAEQQNKKLLDQEKIENRNSTNNSLTLGQFLYDSSILFDGYLIVSAIMFISFNTASLEPHLRHSKITSNPMMISIFFIAEGVSYSLGAMFFGLLLDRHINRTIEFAAIGSICILASMTFMAPLPGIDFLKPNIISSLLCLFILGAGIAAKQIAGYQHAMHHTIHRKGAAGSQQTYGYVAAMFFACLSLGGFIGPIIAGSLIQTWNYRIATMAMFLFECLTLIGIFLMKLFSNNY